MREELGLPVGRSLVLSARELFGSHVRFWQIGPSGFFCGCDSFETVFIGMCCDLVFRISFGMEVTCAGLESLQGGNSVAPAYSTSIRLLAALIRL